MAFYQFKRTQTIDASIDEIWEFIANPENLKHITPESMGFDITSEDLPQMMYAGMIISYRVSPLLGIPTNWVTEITHMKPGQYFVDEQRVGPYKMWHHQHMLEPSDNGVEMTDVITYQPPLGIIGSIANRLFIQRKLNQIFDYRSRMIDAVFNAPQA